MYSLLIPILAGGYAAGIAASVLVERRAGPLGWSMLVVALLLCIVARRRPLLFLPALLGASLLAGWASGSTALHPPLAACHVSRFTGTDEVRLLAAVADDADPLPDGSERQALAAEGLLDGERSAPLCGAVELHRPPGFPRLTPGERVLLRGRLRPSTGSRNPGAPSARLRRLGAGVGAVLYGQPSGLVRLGPPPRPPLLSFLRVRVRRALEHALPHGPRFQVVAALVLGDSALDPALRQAYARSGTSHILSVSGLHLSLVAIAALALLRRGLLYIPPRLSPFAGRDPARLAALPAAGLAILYTLLTGASPPAARSCLMACAGFLALLLHRPPDLSRSLALAVLGLLAWDPLNLFLASFQLSFLAVIGIGLLLGREPDPTAASSGRARRLLRWVRDLLLASLAATLLTAPICAHHFHQLSLAGVLANLLAVPLSSYLLLPASLLGAALGAVHPAAGAPLLALAGWLAAGLNGIARCFAALPGASVQIPLGWLATLGALALALALLLRGRERARVLLRRAALVVGPLLLALAAVLALGRSAAGDVELTFLDVGQGDSTFLRLPDGTSLLVDAGGSLVGGDPGASQVVPFLRGAGVRRLDVAVLSHPHPDHAGGLVSVLRELPVGELWVCWHDEPDPWLAALLAEARRLGVPVRPPRVLERGGVRVRPLWPAGYAGLCADPGFGANDNSLVLRVEHGRGAALLTGDLEADGEQALLRARRDELRADLIKVPHHGSARSSTPEFLRAVAPRVAVVSCGAANHFGFPARPVVARYAALGIELLRVDELGAIRVRLSASGAVRWTPAAAAVP